MTRRADRLGRALALRRRMVTLLGGLAVGSFAAYLAALVLVGERFARAVAGVPLGLWLALAAMGASYAVVVAYGRAATRRLDPAVRALAGEEGAGR